MKFPRPSMPVLALLIVLGGAGCGTPPWQEAGPTPASTSSVTPPRTSTPAPSATPTSKSSVTAANGRNDLSSGSAKRTMEAGGVRLSVNYWSELAMNDWTAEASKTLNLSASSVFIDGYEQNIFLGKITVTMAVSGPDGPLKAPDPLVDTASITPGYLIKKPNSYGQIFTIPALAKGANSIALTLTYELLVQTAPKAKTYAKQTASNDLVISIQA